MSWSPSQITFPASLHPQPTDLRKQISFTDIIENQKEIFMLKNTFKHTKSNLSPATVTVNAAKCELCKLKVNWIVRFSHFLRFSQLLCLSVLYFICICVSQICLMVKYGDFSR